MVVHMCAFVFIYVDDVNRVMVFRYTHVQAHMPRFSFVSAA